MTQYYIIEIKKDEQGNYEHDVKWAFDENPDMARKKGESTYHELLSKAAVSGLETHAVSLLSQEGVCVMHQCYYNLPEAPEPEPQEHDEI